MLQCYITDRRSLPPGVDLLACVADNLAAGPDWIQLREKDLFARDLFDLLRRALALPNPRGVKLIVNGRMDVALAAGAAGVHLPANSVAPRRLRTLAPPGFLIGVSCHDLAEVRAAEDEGADYVLFGPVFSPLSKSTDLPPRRLEGLAQASGAVKIPVLALGGITHENAGECLAAGVAGIAGISLYQSPR